MRRDNDEYSYVCKYEDPRRARRCPMASSNARSPRAHAAPSPTHGPTSAPSRNFVLALPSFLPSVRPQAPGSHPNVARADGRADIVIISSNAYECSARYLLRPDVVHRVSTENENAARDAPLSRRVGSAFPIRRVRTV